METEKTKQEVAEEGSQDGFAKFAAKGLLGFGVGVAKIPLTPVAIAAQAAQMKIRRGRERERHQKKELEWEEQRRRMKVLAAKKKVEKELMSPPLLNNNNKKKRESRFKSYYCTNVDAASILLPIFLNSTNMDFWLTDINNLQFYESNVGEYAVQAAITESRNDEGEENTTSSSCLNDVTAFFPTVNYCGGELEDAFYPRPTPDKIKKGWLFDRKHADLVPGQHSPGQGPAPEQEPLRIFISNKFIKTDANPRNEIPPNNHFKDVKDVNVIFVRRKPYIPDNLYVHKYAISDRENNLKEYKTSSCITDATQYSTSPASKGGSDFTKFQKDFLNKTRSNFLKIDGGSIKGGERRKKSMKSGKYSSLSVGTSKTKKKGGAKNDDDELVMNCSIEAKKLLKFRREVPNTGSERTTEGQSEHDVDSDNKDEKWKYSPNKDPTQAFESKEGLFNAHGKKAKKIFKDAWTLINKTGYAGESNKARAKPIIKYMKEKKENKDVWDDKYALHQLMALYPPLNNNLTNPIPCIDIIDTNVTIFMKEQQKYFDYNGRLWNLNIEEEQNNKKLLFPCTKPLYYDNSIIFDKQNKAKYNGKSPSEISLARRRRLRYLLYNNRKKARWEKDHIDGNTKYNVLGVIPKLDKQWKISDQNDDIYKNGKGWMNEIVCKFTIDREKLKEEILKWSKSKLESAIRGEFDYYDETDPKSEDTFFSNDRDRNNSADSILDTLSKLDICYTKKFWEYTMNNLPKDKYDTIKNLVKSGKEKNFAKEVNTIMLNLQNTKVSSTITFEYSLGNILNYIYRIYDTLRERDIVVKKEDGEAADREWMRHSVDVDRRREWKKENPGGDAGAFPLRRPTAQTELYTDDICAVIRNFMNYKTRSGKDIDLYKWEFSGKRAGFWEAPPHLLSKPIDYIFSTNDRIAYITERHTQIRHQFLYDIWYNSVGADDDPGYIDIIKARPSSDTIAGKDVNTVEVTMAPPLGISVNGDAAAGVFVTKVKDEGAAKASGVVVAGMKILSIDGNNVVGKDKKAVVAVMKTISGAVPFVLAKPEPGAKLPKGSVKMASAPPAAKAAASDAAAAAAAPAAQAAADPNTVEVTMTPPLGISVNGDAATGVFVTKVKDEGAAKASGVVVAGMKILSIDGNNVVGKDWKAVVAVVKAISGAVPFVLAKPEPGTQRLPHREHRSKKKEGRKKKKKSRKETPTSELQAQIVDGLKKKRMSRKEVPDDNSVV